ncbi:MAG: hypothetical protein AAB688_01200 [Patescibacteria group bacterium]
MNNNKIIQWILRIAVAGEFFGHGIFALQGKEQWIKWVSQLTSVDLVTAAKMMFIVGIMDLLVAVIVLFRPIKPVLLWAAFWGFWTALVRPLVGEPIWDFIERFANWGAPLALYFILRSKN